MKIILFSDIHANVHALDAVIRDVDQYHPDAEAYWFLGDLLGYCGSPREAYLSLKELFNREGKQHFWLGGNHEEITLEDVYKLDTLRIGSSDAVDHRHVLELASAGIDVRAILWREKIVRRDQDCAAFFLTHSSYATPDNYHRYLFGWTEKTAYSRLFLDEFRHLPDYNLFRVMLFGHTHVPTLVTCEMGSGSCELKTEMVVPFKTYNIARDTTTYINPGAVGIPNNLDTRAAYAVINTTCASCQVTFQRVAYDIPAAVAALQAKQYPSKFTADIIMRLMQATCDPETPEKWVEHYRQAGLVKRA